MPSTKPVWWFDFLRSWQQAQWRASNHLDRLTPDSCKHQRFRKRPRQEAACTWSQLRSCGDSQPRPSSEGLRCGRRMADSRWDWSRLELPQPRCKLLLSLILLADSRKELVRGWEGFELVLWERQDSRIFQLWQGGGRRGWAASRLASMLCGMRLRMATLPSNGWLGWRKLAFERRWFDQGWTTRRIFNCEEVVTSAQLERGVDLLPFSLTRFWRVG